MLWPEDKLLLRGFARFKPVAEIKAEFEENFCVPPTKFQLERANIGVLVYGKYVGEVRSTERSKYFKLHRQKYLADIRANCAISVKEIRMEWYDILFRLELQRAQKTLNTGKCIALLEAAAKESADFYSRGTTVNVDARSINVIGDKELDTRIRDLLQVFGANPNTVKEIEADKVDETEGKEELENAE